MTSHRPAVLVPVLILGTIAAACSAANPSVPSDPPTSATVEATATPAISAGPSAEPTTEPTDDLGEFACSFPVSGVGTVSRAQLIDVRVGTHDGYDRVVFEFDAGIPEFRLEQATPPLLQDPSGLQMEVEGSAFWRLVLQGGTALSPEGVQTYRGPKVFRRDFPKLAELASAGDFEAVSSWYIGLAAESCVRVLTLHAPSRLVIDIEH